MPSGINCADCVLPRIAFMLMYTKWCFAHEHLLNLLHSGRGLLSMFCDQGSVSKNKTLEHAAGMQMRRILQQFCCERDKEGEICAG